MVAPFNSDKQWTLAEDVQLFLLAAENTPTWVIALKLGRTELAIYARASHLGVSLTPVNRSPYNRM